MFLTSKLLTCFIDSFILKNEVLINRLFTQWKWIYIYIYICWILDLEDKVHSIWLIWTNGLQECKGEFIFWSWVERARCMGFIWARKEASLEQGSSLGKCDLAQDVTPWLFLLSTQNLHKWHQTSEDITNSNEIQKPNINSLLLTKRKYK